MIIVPREITDETIVFDHGNLTYVIPRNYCYQATMWSPLKISLNDDGVVIAAEIFEITLNEPNQRYEPIRPIVVSWGYLDQEEFDWTIEGF